MSKLSNINTIITHPGQAHADDMFACALAIFWSLFHWDHQAPVERRDPTQEEVNDPSILVLDTGGLFDPKLLVFDHHQLSREEGRGQCALTLLLKHLNPEWFEFEMDRSNRTGRSWLEDMALFDSVGPNQAKADGALPGGITQSFLVRKFQEEPNGLAMQVAVDFWDWRHSQFLEYKKLSAWCSEHPVKIHGRDWAEIPSAPDFVKSPFQLIAHYEREWLEHDPSVVIFEDDRGPGWGILRRNDHPQYDFSLLEDHPQVEFAHKGGFIFKTKERLPIRDVLRLIRSCQAMTPEERQYYEETYDV